MRSPNSILVVCDGFNFQPARGASVPWCLCACSTGAAGTRPNRQYGINTPLGDTYAAVTSVADEQTRIVFYRAITPDTTGVVLVYLNERYHASLQKEAFSVVCLSGQNADVRTRYLPAHNADIRPELDTRLAVAMKGGQSVYLRITEVANGTSRIYLVAPKVALKDLTDARQQMHTSRMRTTI